MSSPAVLGLGLLSLKLGKKAAVSGFFWALLGGGGVHIHPALKAFSELGLG